MKKLPFEELSEHVRTGSVIQTYSKGRDYHFFKAIVLVESDEEIFLFFLWHMDKKFSLKKFGYVPIKKNEFEVLSF